MVQESVANHETEDAIVPLDQRDLILTEGLKITAISVWELNLE